MEDKNVNEHFLIRSPRKSKFNTNTPKKRLDNDFDTVFQQNLDINRKDHSIKAENKKCTLSITGVSKLSKILNKQIEDDYYIIKILVSYYKHSKNKIFEWEIQKTYKNFHEFIMNIKLYMRIKEISFEDEDLEIKSNLILSDPLHEYHARRYNIIRIINRIVNNHKMADSYVVLEFLEISTYSFENIHGNNTKPKEGYILKRSKLRKGFGWTQRFFGSLNCCSLWQKRWFVLKDDMIFYLDTSYSNMGKDVFWFDQEIQITKIYKGIPNTLVLINISRKLVLKFEDELTLESWYQLLIKKKEDYYLSIKNSYDSFANEKFLCNSNWFVDAEDYFDHLTCSLLNAKESIFIAGWWVSPELFLERPVSPQDLKKKRLLDILKKKAQQNVQIKILIYKEFKLVLALDSKHTKDVFNDLHPNIKVNIC